MTQARNIVERHMRAYYSGNVEGARALLADDLQYDGPGVHFQSADAFVRGSGHAVKVLDGHEVIRIFEDGDDVCVFFEARLKHQVARMAMVDWYHIEGGRICSIRTLFDTAPFRVPAAGASDESAIDPVCRMTVSKARAPATRSYNGARYYFCNPACADTFDQNPQRHLQDEP